MRLYDVVTAPARARRSSASAGSAVDGRDRAGLGMPGGQPGGRRRRPGLVGARVDLDLVRIEQAARVRLAHQLAQPAVDVPVAADQLPVLLLHRRVERRSLSLRDPARIGQIQPLARPRQRHVVEALVLAVAIVLDPVGDRLQARPPREAASPAVDDVAAHLVVGRGTEAAVDENEVGLEPLGPVHGHDLHGVAVTLGAQGVPLFGLGDDQLRHQAGEPAPDVAQRAFGACGLDGEDLEQLLEVGQPAHGVAGEQLTPRDAAFVEDAAEQPGQVAALGGRVPGEQPIEQRLIGARRGRRQLRERQREERRQPGAQPLGGIVRVGDGAQQIAHLPRLFGLVEPFLRRENGGDAARRQRVRHALRFLANAGEDEDLARVAHLGSGAQPGDLVGDRGREPRPHDAHRQLAPRCRP